MICLVQNNKTASEEQVLAIAACEAFSRLLGLILSA